MVRVFSFVVRGRTWRTCSDGTIARISHLAQSHFAYNRLDGCGLYLEPAKIEVRL
jgi:hypothetical protein